MGGGDRLAVDGDPLDRGLQVRAGGSAGALPERRQQGRRSSERPTSCRSCLRCGCTDSSAAGMLQQLHQRGDPCVLGSSLVSGRWSSRCSTCSSAATRPAWVQEGSCQIASCAVIRSTSSLASCLRPRIFLTTSAGARPGTPRCRVWLRCLPIPFCAASDPSPAAAARPSRRRFPRCRARCWHGASGQPDLHLRAGAEVGGRTGQPGQRRHRRDVDWPRLRH